MHRPSSIAIRPSHHYLSATVTLRDQHRLKMASNINAVEKGIPQTASKASLDGTSSEVSNAPLPSSSLADVVPPHESYEGYGLWDPTFTWSPDEEKKVVWKTDLFLLSAV